MNFPKVSICIICYNQQRYIAEAIESALSQEYPHLEVIVSDDASRDGTQDVIRSLQATHPNLVALLNEENVGVTRNCNRALRACTGEFITFMGGDDAFLPGKIRAQIEWMLQSSERVLCAHDVLHVDAEGALRPAPRPPAIRTGRGPAAFIRNGFVIPGQSIMVRASAVPRHGYDESIPLASDLLYAIEVLCGGGTFGYIPGHYYKYRHLPDSVSTRYFDMLRDIEKTYEVISARYPEYRRLCSEAHVRNVIYFGGVRHLRAGHKAAARDRFLQTLRRRPLYLKAWIRLAQTLWR